MKIFYIALVIFCIVIITVAVNAVYIRKTGDKLTEMINDLPPPDNDNCPDEIESLYKYWKEKHDYICLSVSYIQIDKLTELVISLKSTCESGDLQEYAKVRELLLDAVQEIMRLEQFTLGNIF